MGWQDLHPLIRKAYQSKGGKVKKAKGFATMDRARHLAVSSLGGNNKRDNYNKETSIKKDEDFNISDLGVEEIYGDIEDATR